MSLDVMLFDNEGNEIYSRNITHNLNHMADAALIYQCLWRPDENGITTASQVIEPLERGLALLVTNKSDFENFNPANGWGKWENLVLFCADYLQACRDNPEAIVRVCR